MYTHPFPTHSPTQLASAFGGVNFIEITDYPRAIVTPVALEEPTAAELEQRLATLTQPISSTAATPPCMSHNIVRTSFTLSS